MLFQKKQVSSFRMSANLKFSCFAQSSYFPPVRIIFHITECALLCSELQCVADTPNKV